MQSYNSVPSDRDLISILAIAITQHPTMLNSVIYDPTRPTEPVKIEKIKLYGGRELTEAGLVLGIYPDTVRLGHGMTGYSSEEPIALSQNQVSGATFLTTAHFVAQFTYRVADFDSPISLEYSRADRPLDLNTGSSDRKYFAPLDIRYGNDVGLTYTPESVEVVVLPAEEVLKDWITVLRYAIRDIRYLHPFQVRSPQILAVHYETATIFDAKSTEHLVFHSANVRFKLMYSEGNFDR